MYGKYLKKRVYASVLLSFLAGILYVNLMMKNIGDMNTVFDTYTLKQYQNMELNSGRFFLYLLRLRVVPIGVLTALMFTRARKAAVWGTICWTGFLGGFLMTMAVFNMGMKGSVLCILAGVPHMFFYFIVYAVVLWYGMVYPQGHWDLSKTVFITGTMLAGIFLEAYLNPVILKLFIKML